MAFSTVSRMFNQVTLDHGDRELYHYKNNDSWVGISGKEIRETVKNVAFAQEVTNRDRKTIKFKTWEALKNVGLTSKKDSFPAQLSGGEQQRVAIARAMVNSPQIILADEPTGNLDQKISLEILKLFEELNRNGATIIFATHSQDILKLGNHRVVVLNRGKVVSS